MLSLSDNSSSEEDDSLEFQRLADAAVTLDTNKKVFASSQIKNENAEESQNISSRPSLRPKQTYSDDPYELKLAPGFKIHVANKLSAILDKELEFRSKSVVEKTSKIKSPDSGIRLLSSSKDFLDENSIVAMVNSKASKGNSSKLANSTENMCTSFINHKRENLNSQRVATSSSDSSDDEKLSEAAISFQDIKKKDELLTTYATATAPILVIKKTKEDNRGKKDRIKSDVEAEVCVNGDSTTKKKKKCKEKKDYLEEKDNTDEELIPQISKSKHCTENDSLENENNRVKKRKSDVEAGVCRNDDLNKKKKKKKKCKEKKENSLEEKHKNTYEELIPNIKKSKLCTENDSLENNEEILRKKRNKKNK